MSDATDKPLFTVTLKEAPDGDIKVAIEPHRHYSGPQIVQMLTLVVQQLTISTFQIAQRMGIPEEKVVAMIEGDEGKTP